MILSFASVCSTSILIPDTFLTRSSTLILLELAALRRHCKLERRLRRRLGDLALGELQGTVASDPLEVLSRRPVANGHHCWHQWDLRESPSVPVGLSRK
jgi:hypothetical protein